MGEPTTFDMYKVSCIIAGLCELVFIASATADYRPPTESGDGFSQVYYENANITLVFVKFGSVQIYFTYGGTVIPAQPAPGFFRIDDTDPHETPVSVQIECDGTIVYSQDGPFLSASRTVLEKVAACKSPIITLSFADPNTKASKTPIRALDQQYINQMLEWGSGWEAPADLADLLGPTVYAVVPADGERPLQDNFRQQVEAIILSRIGTGKPFWISEVTQVPKIFPGKVNFRADVEQDRVEAAAVLRTLELHRTIEINATTGEDLIGLAGGRDAKNLVVLMGSDISPEFFAGIKKRVPSTSIRIYPAWVGSHEPSPEMSRQMRELVLFTSGVVADKRGLSHSPSFDP